MTVFKARVWVGPTLVEHWAEKARVAFGCINVLQGTEHLIIINQRSDGKAEVERRLRQLFVLTPRVSEQHAAMRAPTCGAATINGMCVVHPGGLDEEPDRLW